MRDKKRLEEASRYRAARKDSSVGSLTQNIEETYGLPDGCVRLIRPDGSRKRSDATVKSLRNDWED